MKKIFILLFLFSSWARAQELEKELKTTITDVTVFLNSAQITRSGSIQIPKGRSEIRISGLSPYINENSIQVSAKGDFTILAVNYNLNYLQEISKTEQVKDLEKKIEIVNDSLDVNNARITVNKETLDLLEKNKKIGNETSGTDINQLKLAVKYYETEVAAELISNLRLAKKVKELEELKTKLNNQLAELNKNQNQPSGEIVVKVQSEKNSDAVFTASYQAGNAGWNPLYDIRVIDTSSPVELQYNASLWQNTGEDWDNVILNFSNANPNISGTVPEITPWYLDFFNPEYFQNNMGARMKNADMPASETMKAAPAEAAEARSVETQVQENQTSFSFKVTIPYTLKSNGDKLKVELMKYSVPATFNYYVVPKLDNDAFLMASIVNWDQYNLLPGEAGLYFENTFVGRTTINPALQDDTMKISLGRDKSIIVLRKKVDTYSQRKFIGSNKIDSRGFTISLRNNKSKPVNITVIDQVPLSSRSEITVNTVDTGGANYNPATGELKWILLLNPQEQKELKFQYEVRYSKNQRIILE